MCRLLSYKGEATEGSNLQFLVLLLQPLSHIGLVAVAELELLVNQAALLLELLNATLCNADFFISFRSQLAPRPISRSPT